MALLAAATAALVRAARAKIIATGDGTLELRHGTEWYADPTQANVFRSRIPARVWIPKGIVTVIVEDPAWMSMLDVLRNDPVFGGLLDRMVGTALTQTRFDAKNTLVSMLEHAFASRDPVAGAIDWIQLARERWAGPMVEVWRLVVLTGIEAVTPIEIETGVAIRSMTDDEVCTAIQHDVLRPIDPTVTLVTHRCCLSISEPVPLVAMDANDRPDWTDDRRIQSLFRERQDLAIAAIQLTMGIPAYQRGSMTDFGTGIQRTVGAGPSLVRAEPVDPACAARIPMVYRAISRVRAEHRDIDVAIRRFVAANVRQTAEDRLLDLWIAMEALFNPTDDAELSFRIALNAANYLSIDGVPRRDLYDWLRASYTVRSKIVHGAVPKQSQLTRLRGGPAGSMSATTHDLAEVVRTTILRRLDEPQEPDWLGLALRP